jgi:hypothetical protein
MALARRVRMPPGRGCQTLSWSSTRTASSRAKYKLEILEQADACTEVSPGSRDPRGRSRLPARPGRRCRGPQHGLHLPDRARLAATDTDGARTSRVRRNRRPRTRHADPAAGEPGVEPSRVEIDQPCLRAEHAAGKRTAAVRLNYALRSFPSRGATVGGTALSPATGRKPSRKPTWATPARSTATAFTSPARTSAPPHRP